MKNVFLFIVTLMFGHFVQAQSVNEKKTAEVAVSQVSLSKKYATKD